MSITNNFEPYATGSDYPSCRSECEAQRLKEGEEDGEQQKVTILQTMFKNQHLGPPAHGISSSVNVSDIILDALRNDEAMNYNSEDEHQCEAMDTFDSNPRTSRCRSRSSDWVIGQDESSIFNSIFFEDINQLSSFIKIKNWRNILAIILIIIRIYRSRNSRFYLSSFMPFIK